MRISLVGLPGVGKSTIGRRLADRLEVDFVDCDAVAEERIGGPIAAFFERDGEAAFRTLEETVLRELTTRDGVVIATGGGVVLREANRRLLRDRTLCIYLDSPAEMLVGRLRRSSRRPLLRGVDPQARIVELAEQRDSLYRETAALVVRADGGAASTLAAVESALRLHATAPGEDGDAVKCQ